MSASGEALEAATLDRTWADPPGLRGWLATVDHHAVGRRFIVTAFVFFLLAGLLALAMRLQLAVADNTLIGPDLYNQLFSVHGTAMMFLFAVPIMEAMGIYLVPMMVGSRSIAFPRLNAFSYWILLFGGVMLFVAFALNIGPEVGWFSYPPLAGPEYSAGKRQDFWAQLITFSELSALIGAINIITTAFKMRTPGMTLGRMPLLVWSLVITSLMIIFAMPTVMLGSTFLLTDRLVSTQFYNPAEGGDALLWQHLFWFFGHPEVYIIFLPGLGMISQILPTFCRRRIFGYFALLLALAVTAFLAFGLWVHHMFATGLPPVGMSFFTAASIFIAIPTGLQIFCWIATIAGSGDVRFASPMLFITGFFFIFIIGGLTGVMLGSMTLDSQLHDSYFVVAHLHYVLIGGAVFPLFGGFHYWFPKITGRRLSATASPPPRYSFVRTPIVSSRDPLWDDGPRGFVTGLPTDLRSTLVTRVHDAAPDHVELLASPTLAPLVTALAVTVMFIGSIFTPWAMVWGAVPVAIALIWWFWPDPHETAEHQRREIKPVDDLQAAR